MKLVALIFLITFAVDSSFGQDRFTLSIGTGIGTYRMHDLKSYQSAKEAQMGGVPFKRVHDFPAYPYYFGEVLYRINSRWSLAANYQIQSTGCKSAYSDYSGMLTYKLKLIGNVVGIGADFRVWEAGKLSIATQLRVAYAKTRMYEANYLDLYGEPGSPFSERDKYETKSIMVTPGIAVSYSLIAHFYLNVYVGYCFDMKGDLEISQLLGPFFWFRDPYWPGAKVDWSGLRAGVSASYKFGR